MTERMLRIERLIATETDPKRLRVLNRAWWREYFRETA